MIFRLLLIVLLCSTQVSYGQSRIERIEPPNWWAGMETDTIQLLVYGDNVASLTPIIKNKSVKILGTIVLESPNYLFIDIKVDGQLPKRKVKINFLENKRKVESITYPILARQDNRKNLEGFDNSDAIYLITPDRFANGDATNDYISPMLEKPDRENIGGRHGGDIQGIQNNLDYIVDLGFSAIWLNPLLENDMETYSYHGYSTTDFYKVDPRFGSNEAYLEMTEEARDKGLKLIMDMIVNHCGLEHWWMTDYPSPDWINEWDEYTQTNHRKTVLQDPYVSELDKKTFTDGWFVPTMPDLNQRNEQMATYLIQNSIWWVEYLGLAGIRMDTYPYPDMYFMTDWTKAMMKEYPDLNIVGEEWFGEPAIVSYWQKGKKNPNGYASELKSLMDFPIQSTLVKALTEEEGWSTGWMALYEVLAQDFLYADPQNLVVFPDNHDMSRIFTQVEEDYGKFQQALTYILTTRGIPQIYYGTEILMKNPGTEDHGIIRSDFPGGWKGDKTNGFTNKGLSEEAIAAKTWLTILLEWRKTASAVHTGKLTHFLPNEGVYVYFRYDDDQKIMVVLNKNTEDYILDLKRFAEMFDGETKGKNVFTQEEILLGKSITVGGNGATVLEIF